MLRYTDRRESTAAEGAARVEGAKISASTIHAAPGGDAHHVPLLRKDWRRRRRGKRR